jgi:SHS2 domain-containing protein
MAEARSAPLPSRFEIVEHTADLGLAGQAPSFAELCVVMARAQFSVVCDIERVEPRVRREIEVEAKDETALLHAWLREVNGLHQEHGEIYSRFTVEVEGHRLRGTAEGERMDPARHDLRHEVKGVTWHDFKVEKAPGGYRAYALLDV